MMMRSSSISSLLLLVALVLNNPPFVAAQSDVSTIVRRSPPMTWSTESVGPQRFLAVHGRKSVVMGYPAAGLEVWAYPLQLVSDYQVNFLPTGQTQTISGTSILRRIDYRPDEVVRTYVGDDFIIHERIFVPLDQPGAILSYQVEGRQDVSVQVQFRPSLNLMWPSALGGQSTQWDDKLSGYSIREPLHGFSAAIASPDVISHDPTGNRTIQPSEDSAFKTLLLKPRVQSNGARIASVFIGYDPPHTSPDSRIILRMEREQVSLRAATEEHYKVLLADSLQIQTPDEELNRALRWSIGALDQAWVCNDSLGCGEIAGYGPSRPGRRPQYAWFFAGDGLVATDALVAAGNYTMARQELAFVTQYQNKNNGMIWHELSQSADLADWAKKYPYMYVHVDITFEYLTSFANYVRVSGDREFLKANWSNLQAAYAYCESLIDSETGLPKIPAGQEGGNEQDRMRDDLGLSSSWIAASSSFAQIARIMGSPKVDVAERAANAARKAIAQGNWDSEHHFWLTGHTVNGQPIYDQRPNPSGILSQQVFSSQQTAEVLDQLASPNFQTDWGMRSMSSLSARFDPNSYAGGSVSALGSSTIASTFWQQHRPITGWQIWASLIPWSTLDAPGHIHEVLAGDFYHPQTESVPEQTWSSAGFLHAAVTGLLGLEVESGRRYLKLSPHLPVQWDALSIGNIRVGSSMAHIQLKRDSTGIEMQIENSGDPISFTFAPEIPLGATIGGGTCQTLSKGRMKVQVHKETHDQDQHASTSFVAEEGTTSCRIAYRGGVEVGVNAASLQVGEDSIGIKVKTVHLKEHTLTIDAWVRSDKDQTLKVSTTWKPASVIGGSITQSAPGMYIIHIETHTPKPEDATTSYIPSHIIVRFNKTE
jgi:glycogen debranching enzyme